MAKERPNSFAKQACPLCARQTWHIAGHCTDHSPWPPKTPKAIVSNHIVNQGYMGTRKELPRPVTGKISMPPPQGSARYWRACGHRTVLPYRTLCVTCKLWLARNECLVCLGYTRPLPACACQVTYSLDARGEIRTRCEVCYVPTKPKDLAMVVVGRWGKVLKRAGWHVDTQAGVAQPLFEERLIPLTRRVPGCPCCQARYHQMCLVTPPGKTAWLRVGDL